MCVLPSAPDETWMRNVAGEMNLSETAFLHPEGIHPEERGYRLRWLTPVIEVDLCGHATLASAHILWEDGHLDRDAEARFHTRSGLLTCTRNGDWIEMDFPAKIAEPAEAPPQLADALGTDLAWVGRNQFDYLVQVANETTLRSLNPNHFLLRQLPVRGVIVTAKSKNPEFDFVSRYFAPATGLNEDPVTGSAHCTLAPYWCDRLGLMVWGEMPNARAWSTGAEERFVAEWERAVRRDTSHPCIIAWVPVNESWGVPDLREDHPGQYAFLERIVALTRRLDPDRPVIDNDGWEHTDISDIIAVHDYTPSGAELRVRYAETLQGGPLPPKTWGTGGVKTFARGAAHRGQPIMLTEVGGFLMQPELPPEKWDNLYTVYGYTQLTDIEQEINGLLTYDRRPKVDPEKIREIHQRLFLKPA